MSISKHFFFFIFNILVVTFCFGEFPLIVPIDPESLPREILEQHGNLKEIIKQAPKEALKSTNRKALKTKIDDKNYFVANLMFYIEGEQNPLVLEIKQSYFPQNDPYIKIFCLTINDHLVTVNKHFSGKSYDNVSNSIVFNNIKALQDEFLTAAQILQNPQALIMGGLWQTINSRIHFSEKEPSYIVLNTDSEAYMLAYLQEEDVQTDIITAVKHLINDKKVTKIVFNGCTTRVMCGLCCTSINMVQYIANKYTYENEEDYFGPTFLTSIKLFLIKEKLAEADCPITIYISSIRSYGDDIWFSLPLQAHTDSHVNIFQLND